MAFRVSPHVTCRHEPDERRRLDAEREHLMAVLAETNERLRLLTDAGNLLLSTRAPEQIVQIIAGRVMAHLRCDCFFNYVLDETSGRLMLNAYAGVPEETARTIKWLDLGVAICGCVARDGVRIVSEDVQHNGDPRADLVRSFGIQVYACHPLKIGAQTIGTLSFGARSRVRFEDDELDLMKTVAGQVSMAMERRRSEDALKRHALHLETANKELESFSYSVSHDLRAPLRAINGFAALLEERYGGVLDAEGRRLIDVIRDNSSRMGELVDDLLDFSRLGRAAIRHRPVDMTAAAREAYAELAQTMAGRCATLSLAPLPPAQGDENLLRLVFSNLISNAIKFSSSAPDARIEIGGSAQSGQLTYYVKDNGVGFDMEYAHKLFGVFQRLHSADTFEGTGIGLALVKRIVERHGGRVWAAGAPGAGATFSFSLPA